VLLPSQPGTNGILRLFFYLLLFGLLKFDEDINISDIIISFVEKLSSIIRSQAQQLNHQINSFLYSFTYNIESRLLPNDLIILINQEEYHRGQTGYQQGVAELIRCAREDGEPIQFIIAEFEFNSESRITLHSH
jgi:hypothetical protein